MATDWITTKAAAHISGYHPDHVRRLIRAGEIQARKFGEVWQVSRQSLQRYLERVAELGKRRGPKTG